MRLKTNNLTISTRGCISLRGTRTQTPLGLASHNSYPFLRPGFWVRFRRGGTGYIHGRLRLIHRQNAPGPTGRCTAARRQRSALPAPNFRTPMPRAIGYRFSSTTLTPPGTRRAPRRHRRSKGEAQAASKAGSPPGVHPYPRVLRTRMKYYGGQALDCLALAPCRSPVRPARHRYHSHPQRGKTRDNAPQRDFTLDKALARRVRSFCC